MHAKIRRLARAGLLSALLLPSTTFAGYREDLKATSIEIAQLPTFCWVQFEVPNANGDEYNIKNCGVFVNHYCPGLLDLIRAKHKPAKRYAVPLLVAASDEVAYTEHGIASYPQCPIRDHVAATRAEINQLMRMYGVKPPRHDQ
jgi:hypothetical protein